MTFDEIGLHVPTILLPNQDIDMTKWSVIACDQYTSQPEYWEKVYALVNSSPSSLNIILPEIYLKSCNINKKAEYINKNMLDYVKKGILIPQMPGFYIIDRKTAYAESRKGLIAALDLEKYNFEKGSKTLIRATEDTIISRVHPRIKIRENALIELPHILVLVDDPEKTVIEPLFDRNPEKIYDFELMINSGHIKGYRINDTSLIKEIANNLAKLADPEVFHDKYGVPDKNTLLYAIGDGNHSFATAKILWERIKQKAENNENIMNHPARYALVELVNLHDEGLSFKPINRVVFNIDIEDILQNMKSFYEKRGSLFSYKMFETNGHSEIEAINIENAHNIPFVTILGSGNIIINNPEVDLEVENLQLFLDSYVENKRDAYIDYVHGKDATSSLASAPNRIGFFLPPLQKNKIFKTVILNGALPRKAFSIGEAEEKRFYLESRRIQ